MISKRSIDLFLPKSEIIDKYKYILVNILIKILEKNEIIKN